MNPENRPSVPEVNPAATLQASVTASQPAASRRTRWLVLAGVATVVAIGLVVGITPRVRARQQLASAARELVRPNVSVTNASRSSQNLELTLPGDVHAFEETRIYARADGYLLKWNTDIGSRVTAGELLAEIDTPELDQDLNQARARLEQADANLVLARSSAERWQALLKDRAVSQQEVDEKSSALVARAADVQAAKAAVSRLEKLTSFKQVRAPFAGTITRRYVDPGALIHGGASGNASALFDLAQMDTLRVQVNVPQAYLRDVATGSSVQVQVAEYPDRRFTGKILRTSGAFDPGTRTLLTEIELPNQDGALFPGIHVDVALALTQAEPPLVVPATSLMIRATGLQVAVVNDADRVQLQKVRVGRDLGRMVEIVSGLEAGTRIVTNPTDTLADGVEVKVGSNVTPKPGSAQIARR